MKNAAVASSSAKLRYNAKPKIKVWTTEIKSGIGTEVMQEIVYF
jgi:hypothetical protein